MDGYKYCYGNGWVTVTLNRLLSNGGYNKFMREGEDIQFNWNTINYGYNYFLLPLKLGHYCNWNIGQLSRSDQQLDLQSIRDTVRLIDF